MNLLQSVGDFFALDIGTTAVRAVKLRQSGNGWIAEHFGSVPIDIRVSTSDAPEDQKRLSEAISTLIGQSNINSRNVVLGIPSNKMFATVVDIADMPKDELDAAIKYQAEQYVPMNLDEAKIDWAVLGKSLNDATKNEVLLVSVANAYSESRLDLIEGLGLNVVAIEPDSVAIVRALLPPNSKGAQMLINVGDSTTDVIVTYDEMPRLIRSLPTGLASLTKLASQRLSIDEAQATQFLLKFGVQPDKLEGQLFRAVEATIEQFASELAKSVSFFETKYPNTKVNGIILAGYGQSVPGLADYIGKKAGLPTIAGNPWEGVSVSRDDQQRLVETGAAFAVAIGLAKRRAE